MIKSTKKSKQLLDLSKEDLEHRKLLLEIKQLEVAWWKRPNVLGIVLPVALGFATLGVGYITGFFNTQRALLEIQTTELRLEKNELAGKRKLLKDSLQAERLYFKSEIKDYDSILTYERLKTTKEMGELEKQQLMAQAESAKLKKIITEEREKAIMARIQVNLEILLEDRKKPEWSRTRVNPQHPSIQKLINLLSTKDQRAIDAVNLVIEKNQIDTVIVGNLLYSLYKSTGDKNWLKELIRIGIAIKEGSPQSAEFWNIFSMGFWDVENSYEELIELMRDAKLKRYTQAYLFFGFRRPILKESFKNLSNYFDGIELARDLAMDETMDTYERIYGLNALFNFDPKAYLIIASNLWLKSEKDSAFHKVLLSEIGFHRSVNNLDELAREIKFPIDLTSEWQDWLEKNSNLINSWLEPGLIHLRKN